jgi:tRNA(Arg) A34 adenosine deaminase TadA
MVKARRGAVKGGNEMQEQSTGTTASRPLEHSHFEPPPRDDVFMRAAFALAVAACKNGEEPSGALLVNATGEVAGSADNTQISRKDFLGHAEVNLIRRLAQIHTFKHFRTTTLYTAIEPCVMCCGAICLSGIGRVVYGMPRRRFAQLVSCNPVDLSFSCREILARASWHIDVDGPVLEKEVEDILLRTESTT